MGEAAGRKGSRTIETVHIRCGSDIREKLRLAGLPGRFVEFSDPYCQGPVRLLPAADLLAERVRFLAAAYDSEAARTRRELVEAERAVEQLGPEHHAVLWFEHDSYDQLVLARLLDLLAARAQQLELELICIDSHPDVDRFIGLGQLSPDQLLALWPTRRALTGADLALGQAVWRALRLPDPTDLAAIAAAGTPAIPQMGPAVKRHLQELPWRGTGLGLTQRLVLDVLADGGPATGSQLFWALYHEREPLPFLGDLMLWHVLADLTDADRPVMAAEPGAEDEPWARRTLGLTETGRAVLAGELDFLSLYRGERWVGGVRVARDAALPRWDPGTGMIAAPA